MKNHVPQHPAERDLLTLLKDIDSGMVSVTLDKLASGCAPSEENGVYVYRTSNKWTVEVFVDCGRFDYLEGISHGGTSLTGQILTRHYPRVSQFAERFRDPSRAKRVWGIEPKIYAGL